MDAATLFSCEMAAPLRRSRSVGLRGRYGDSECLTGATLSCGYRLVEKNTFLEVEFGADVEFGAIDEENDDDDNVQVGSTFDIFGKDDCVSEPSSDAPTRISSTLWSDMSDEDESDHEDVLEVPIPSRPQGNCSVGQVAMIYYIPTVMVPAPVAPTTAPPVVPAQPSFPARSAQKKKSKSNGDSRTSVMITNVPADCTNSMMVEMLNSAGLSSKYDFVYAPTDFRTYTAFGYAFINFINNKTAVQAMDVLSGLICPTWSEQKLALEVSWCETHQGLKVHVSKYQNSPVMHPSVLDDYKPLLFKNGVRQPFPRPTKTIKEPRLRRTTPA